MDAKPGRRIHLPSALVFNNQVETAVYQTWQEMIGERGPILMNNSQFNLPYQHQASRLMRVALRWTF